MAIQLVTDSTSYIPVKLLQKHNIKVFPLNVNFEDESFLDIPEHFTAFYKKLETVDYIPKSSQPPVAMIEEVFETALKKGDSIIGVFLSSKMSGMYSTACMVRAQLLETYPESTITIIDSTTNCMQLGLIVLAGAKEIEGGRTHDEVSNVIQRTIPKTRFIFSPLTLEYLKRGGRIGTASAFLGQILQVKPILTVKEGITTSLDKVRSRKKAIKYLINKVVKDAEVYGISTVIIHHIEAGDEAEKLKAQLVELLALEEMEIVSLGPVIGTHVGPGALGIAYETNKPITE